VKTPHTGRARSFVVVLIACSALLAVPAATLGREPRAPDGPPFGERLRAIDVGHFFADCAIGRDRSLVCWRNSVGFDSAELSPDSFDVFGPPRGDFRAVSVGETHACAIRTNHRISCWGSDVDGRTKSPKGKYIDVAAGWFSTCAIRFDKTLACWGGEDFDNPPPSGTFTSLDAGLDGYCALRTDRTAACWGDFGPNPPTGEFTDLAILGWARACGIRPDTTLACWGHWDAEEDVYDEIEPYDGAERISELVAQIGRVRAVGDTCAIRVDRSLVCFAGNPLHDQVGPLDPGVLFTQPVTHQGRFKAVSGDCAIRTDGTLFCTGPMPPATDMASSPAPRMPTDPFWDYVLLGLSGAFGAGVMLVRLGRTADRGAPTKKG
jgi:hypothetical protein